MIGSKIRKARVNKNWSQEQFAETLNISQASLSRIESDKQKPQIGLLKTICQLLDLDYYEFLDKMSTQPQRKV